METTNYKYWYRDSWTGVKKKFYTLPEAKKEAKKEYYFSIPLYVSS